MQNLRKYGISDEVAAAKRAAGFIWCSRHKDFVPLSEMGGRSYGGYCRACDLIYQRGRSEERWGYHLQTKFKTTAEWYAQQQAAQQGRCALCGNFNGKRRLAVDHNHLTGQLRELLCTPCNVALERLETIPGWADLAKAYLEKFLVR